MVIIIIIAAICVAAIIGGIYLIHRDNEDSKTDINRQRKF